MLESDFKVDAATFIPIEESEELVDKYLGNARGEKEAVHVKQLLFVQLTVGTLTQEPPDQGTVRWWWCSLLYIVVPVPILHLFLRVFGAVRQLPQFPAGERRQFIAVGRLGHSSLTVLTALLSSQVRKIVPCSFTTQ